MTRATALKTGAKDELAEKMLAFWDITPSKDSYLASLADNEEMLLELFEIRKLLGGLYRSQENERQFLRRRQGSLDAVPMDLILAGGDQVKKLRQFVEYVCWL